MKDEMYIYLLNHNYISFNKTSDKQQELSVERAECIVNKCDNLLNERQQRIDMAIEFLERFLSIPSNRPTHLMSHLDQKYLKDILKGDSNG